jgi:hypothetical protein
VIPTVRALFASSTFAIASAAKLLNDARQIYACNSPELGGVYAEFGPK